MAAHAACIQGYKLVAMFESNGFLFGRRYALSMPTPCPAKLPTPLWEEQTLYRICNGVGPLRECMVVYSLTHSLTHSLVNAKFALRHCLRSPDDGPRRPSWRRGSTLIMSTRANEQARRR
jgi:hypothetical protein